MKQVDAFIVDRNNTVYLEKKCNQHGNFSILICEDAKEYSQLQDFYFNIVPQKLPQVEYYLHITNRCNISCPVCFLDFSENGRELSLDSVQKLVLGGGVKRVTFSHSEATTCENLPEMVKVLRRSGKIVNIHTNGIKLADSNYASSLKSAGIHHISLQFDGFDDKTYIKLRGGEFLNTKLKALNNLRRLSIPVTLNVTIARGVNEDQVGAIFDFALKEKFIKDISYITYSNYGRDSVNMDKYIMPSQLLKNIEEHSQGKISRKAIYLFQKVFFAYCSAFKKRKCFYYYHYLVIRGVNGYTGVDEILDLERLCRALDHLKEDGLRINRARFLAILIGSLRVKSLLLFPSSFAMLFRGGFPGKPGRLLALTFATICDPYKYDAQIAVNCGQGILGLDTSCESYGEFLMEDIIKRNRRSKI
ncbi:MAG: radical SAM protein [Candidatus Omnitrophota bacterium]|nr:radical SAM protein [Candidatus Omnitrophota bacterium]MBU1928375.1 radical SAM protein [Candidatus Omnitrophota bacterium]